MSYQIRLRQLKSARAETISRAEKLAQFQIEYCPAADRWSVGEVLDHLVLMEGYFRGVVARLIGQAQDGDQPLVRITFSDFNPAPRPLPKSWLPSLELPFTVLSSVTPYKAKAVFAKYRMVRMEAPDIGLPRSRMAATELINRLGAAFKETEALFASNLDLELRELTFRHPFSGKMNVVQLLEILTLHERRHQNQMNDILSSPGFPG